MKPITPEQKAENIIAKYLYLFQVELENSISLYEATHCALIEVKGIIDSLKITLGHLTLKHTDSMEFLSDLEYHQKVKQVLTNKLK